MELIEATAVVFGIAYLLLAVREHIWCWYAAAVSTVTFLYIFWEVRLLMESALQLYYLFMAGYGWYHWQRGGTGGAERLPITTWPLRRHLWMVMAILIASLLSGWLLSYYTDARLPFVDSFTTWGSIVTTWMVARKLLENWLYWLVIDSVSIWLYLDRQLYLTVGLFAVYLVIAVFGYWQWRRQFILDST